MSEYNVRIAMVYYADVRVTADNEEDARDFAEMQVEAGQVAVPCTIDEHGNYTQVAWNINAAESIELLEG